MVAVVFLAAVACGARGWNSQPYHFALIGNDGMHLKQEREAGIAAKVLDLSWRDFYTSEGKVNTSYVEQKNGELTDLHEADLQVILSLGFHDTPPWVHENYPNSYYVNQFGERWTGDNFVNGVPRDNGDANLIFNRRLRGSVASYANDVFSEFGTDFYAVRLGGGRYGELTYPPADFGGKDNNYWAYDQNAQRDLAKARIGGWRPGDPSPDGQASRFLTWYLDSLVNYQKWQVSMVGRAGYSGKVMMLYPGWGIRPGQIKQATAAGLVGSTPAEMNGEIQSGHDFARQVGAIEDTNVLVTTTWLDANASRDNGKDPRYWSPVKYLSFLSEVNPVRPGLYGENTGRGSLEDMLSSVHQMRRYGLVGMAWYKESELLSGRYATLTEYERIIESSQENRR